MKTRKSANKYNNAFTKKQRKRKSAALQRKNTSASSSSDNTVITVDNLLLNRLPNSHHNSAVLPFDNLLSNQKIMRRKYYNGDFMNASDSALLMANMMSFYDINTHVSTSTNGAINLLGTSSVSKLSKSIPSKVSIIPPLTFDGTTTPSRPIKSSLILPDESEVTKTTSLTPAEIEEKALHELTRAEEEAREKEEELRIAEEERAKKHAEEKEEAEKARKAKEADDLARKHADNAAKKAAEIASAAEKAKAEAEAEKARKESAELHRKAKIAAAEAEQARIEKERADAEAAKKREEAKKAEADALMAKSRKAEAEAKAKAEAEAKAKAKAKAEEEAEAKAKAEAEAKANAEAEAEAKANAEAEAEAEAKANAEAEAEAKAKALEAKNREEAAKALEAKNREEAAKALEAKNREEAAKALEAKNREEAAKALEAKNREEAAKALEAKNREEAAKALEAKKRAEAAKALEAKNREEALEAKKRAEAAKALEAKKREEDKRLDEMVREKIRQDNEKAKNMLDRKKILDNIVSLIVSTDDKNKLDKFKDRYKKMIHDSSITNDNLINFHNEIYLNKKYAVFHNKTNNTVQIGKKVFTIVGARGDGNCQYNSVAIILNNIRPGNNYTGEKIRKQVGDYIKSHKNEFSFDFLLYTDEKDKDKKIDEYIDDICKNNKNVWGDQTTLIAMMKIFKLCINIVQVDSLDITYIHYNNDMTKYSFPLHKTIDKCISENNMIYLWHTNELHYDALIEIKENNVKEKINNKFSQELISKTKDQLQDYLELIKAYFNTPNKQIVFNINLYDGYNRKFNDYINDNIPANDILLNDLLNDIKTAINKLNRL
jgi:hypothetical protein